LKETEETNKENKFSLVELVFL